jgi:hypothetical protein
MILGDDRVSSLSGTKLIPPVISGHDEYPLGDARPLGVPGRRRSSRRQPSTIAAAAAAGGERFAVRARDHLVFGSVHDQDRNADGVGPESP